MSERQHDARDDAAGDDAAGTAQFPHVPGQDPRDSGMPRERGIHPAENAEEAADDAAQSARETGDSPPDEGDAPLGGTETTEDELTADTAVERDALKSLDPDDTPA